MSLPEPRGPISERVLGALARAPGDLPAGDPQLADDPLSDDDLQLALYLCYELHYRGLPGVDDRWEWDQSLIGVRATLEDAFEAALEAAVPCGRTELPEAPIDEALRMLAAEDAGPSLSAYVRTVASREQIHEFLIHRSAYQLKEADPHSWAIPRLTGVPKAALVEIQADEYGGGRPEWIHAELFARSMRAVGLDATYGAYLDVIPGVTLATVNLMSLLGLHRRLRGALVGHLALFEMTSSIPNRRYGDGLRRLRLGGDATLFFDEHVTADAVHEQVAAVDLAGGLVAQSPELAADVMWGARALALLDAAWGEHLIARWRAGESSLREALVRVPA